jgi:hypothetical protein
MPKLMGTAMRSEISVVMTDPYIAGSAPRIGGPPFGGLGTHFVLARNPRPKAWIESRLPVNRA